MKQASEQKHSVATACTLNIAAFLFLAAWPELRAGRWPTLFYTFLLPYQTVCNIPFFIFAIRNRQWKFASVFGGFIVFPLGLFIISLRG